MNTLNDWVVQNCRTGSLLPCDSIHGERGTLSMPEIDSNKTASMLKLEERKVGGSCYAMERVTITDLPFRNRKSLPIEMRTESLK
jgi:hypothetical protein